MKVTRLASIYLLLFACLPVTLPASAQMFKPQLDFSLGGGINVSYFDVGEGNPLGFSLTSTTMYHWTEHWKAGFYFGAHNVKGTDEGTRHLGRGLAYDSYLYEFTGRVEYIFYFAPSWKSRTKQKINPMLPYGGTWKRKIKPFLTAGGGIVQYKPYVYYYPININAGLDENPALASVAPLFKGGFGIYYFFNRYFSVVVEANANLPLFNYFEDYKTEEIEDKWDWFNVITIRVIWSQSAS